MKVNDFIYEIFATARASPICGIPVIRRLTPTSVNVRVPITGGQFVDTFHNESSGRTAFALIKNNRRIFGADNTGGWHLHPFDDPTQHDPLNAPMTFSEFIQHIESHLTQP
ncbi:MAG: hypothetical protein ACREOI_00865 [bacterium]